MKEFWDKRYSEIEYAYGREPNRFFAAKIENQKPGKILLPAEGEGRNAVFAAKLGWDVVAFDISEAGRQKALKLAKEEDVTIDYKVASFADFSFPENTFDSIALIYSHIPDNLRKEYHRKLCKILKPGGKLILEAFSKQQIKNNTGGPKSIELLFSKPELEDDFSILKKIEVEELQVVLKEGEFHNGKAELIRLYGEK